MQLHRVFGIKQVRPGNFADNVFNLVCRDEMVLQLEAGESPRQRTASEDCGFLQALRGEWNRQSSFCQAELIVHLKHPIMESVSLLANVYLALV